jgi:hypothetical protein
VDLHARTTSPANQDALDRFARGDALLAGTAPAREALPVLTDGWSLSHAGTPLPYAEMCGPMQGALCGAMLFEGWAESVAEAHAALLGGAVRLHSNHEIGAVAPMAGVLSPSMGCFVVENPSFGNRVATIINEGVARDVLRCGANGPAVIARLRRLNQATLPAIAAALSPAFSLREIMAEAALMGDELHQRNVAASLLFLRRLLPRLEDATELGAYFAGTLQFFLNLGMAASKALLDPLSGIAGCSLVTAMSRNGVHFAIRLSGCGERWFRAPSPRPEGVYWEPFGPEDANLDIGDSAIVETAGAGGFLLPGAPAVHSAVGCRGAAHALEVQREMRLITATQSPIFTTSPADGEYAPFGVDADLVMRHGVTPAITTGVAGRIAGTGMIGAGIVRAPLACFAEAAAALHIEQVQTRGAR